MTQTIDRMSARYAQFPANWRYCNGSPAERDQFNRILSELVAEELALGLAATSQIDELIGAAAAGEAKIWLDDVRAKLRDMVVADAFLNDRDEGDLTSAVEKAGTALDRAEAKVIEAEQARDAAKAQKRGADMQLAKWHDAQTTMGTGDIVLQAAWSHRQSL